MTKCYKFKVSIIESKGDNGILQLKEIIKEKFSRFAVDYSSTLKVDLMSYDLKKYECQLSIWFINNAPSRLLNEFIQGTTLGIMLFDTEVKSCNYLEEKIKLEKELNAVCKSYLLYDYSSKKPESIKKISKNIIGQMESSIQSIILNDYVKTDKDFDNKLKVETADMIKNLKLEEVDGFVDNTNNLIRMSPYLEFLREYSCSDRVREVANRIISKIDNKVKVGEYNLLL